jgi:hypothetical protein
VNIDRSTRTVVSEPEVLAKLKVETNGQSVYTIAVRVRDAAVAIVDDRSRFAICCGI